MSGPVLAPNQTFCLPEPARPSSKTRKAQCAGCPGHAISPELNCPSSRTNATRCVGSPGSAICPELDNLSPQTRMTLCASSALCPEWDLPSYPARHEARAVPSTLLRTGPSVRAQCMASPDRAIGSETDIPSAQTRMALHGAGAIPTVPSTPNITACPPESACTVRGQSRFIHLELDRPSARTRRHDPRAMPSAPNRTVGLPYLHDKVRWHSRPRTGPSICLNPQGAVRGQSRPLLTGPSICPRSPQAGPSICPNPKGTVCGPCRWPRTGVSIHLNQ